MTLFQVRVPARGIAQELRAEPTAMPPTALVDRAARHVEYMRVSLTDRCNFRCTYCMPDRPLDYGPRSALLSLEEVVAACTMFARWGVRRVRLTGGEPTLRQGLVELVHRLVRVPLPSGGSLEVVMTTNGERLPELAAPLRDAGLCGLTVSLDSLDPGRFRQITRRGSLDRVLAGLEQAAAVGFAPIKLNTVAVLGFNDDEVVSLAKFAWDRGYVPRFIELMPMASGELFVPGQLMSAAQVRGTLAASLGVDLIADEGSDVRGSGPARYHRVAGGPYAGALVGTIAAMTENFCASCNRLRLSATGQLHGCLARDDTGDLRSALRSGAPGRAEAVVRAVLGTKRDEHGFNIDGSGGPAKAMVTIGG